MALLGERSIDMRPLFHPLSSLPAYVGLEQAKLARERNQGCFIPGTRHSIVSYLDLPKYQVGKAILMNPNHRAETLEPIKQADLDAHLIDLTQ